MSEEKKKSDEKKISSKVKVVDLGYEDEECTKEKKAVIKEISGLQMTKIVDVMEESTERAEELGMKHFKIAKNNMDLNQRLLAIGITYPKPTESEEEYELRLDESIKRVQLAPQRHIDEAMGIMLSINDLQSFLAKNLMGVLQQIALQVSVMAKRIAETEAADLEKSMSSSQKNTDGRSGK